MFKAIYDQSLLAWKIKVPLESGMSPKSIIFSLTHYEHLQHNLLSYFVYSQINAAPT